MADDYIKREDAIAALENLAKPYYKSRLVYDRSICAGINTALREVQRVPAADVRPVARGQWINDRRCGFGSVESECSICGRNQIRKSYYDFCPNCGADMREDEITIS